MKHLLKKAINNFLSDCQGCKLTELVCDLSSLFYNKEYDKILDSNDVLELLELLSFISSSQNFGELLIKAIDEMIDHKEVSVVVYTLPSMSYREKLFLLPKNSNILKVIASNVTITLNN